MIQNEGTFFLTVLIIFLAEVNENNQEHQNVQNATSQLTCKICWESVVGIIFLPCSDLVCCVQCSAAMTQCPVCRTRVSGTIKVNIWPILTLCQKSFLLHHEFYFAFIFMQWLIQKSCLCKIFFPWLQLQQSMNTWIGGTTTWMVHWFIVIKVVYCKSVAEQKLKKIFVCITLNQ